MNKMVNSLFKDRIQLKVGPCQEMAEINKGIDRYLSDLELDNDSNDAEKIVNREFSCFSLMDPSLVKNYFFHYISISEFYNIHKDTVDKAELRAVEGSKITKDCYDGYHLRCQNCLLAITDSESLTNIFELYVKEIYACLKYAIGVTDEIPKIVRERIVLKNMGETLK